MKLLLKVVLFFYFLTYPQNYLSYQLVASDISENKWTFSTHDDELIIFLTMPNKYKQDSLSYFRYVIAKDKNNYYDTIKVDSNVFYNLGILEIDSDDVADTIIQRYLKNKILLDKAFQKHDLVTIAKYLIDDDIIGIWNSIHLKKIHTQIFNGYHIGDYF